MNIDELTILDLYNLKDDKVTSAFLQVIGYGGAVLLRSFINSCAYFSVLPVFLLFKHQLRCREPVLRQGLSLVYLSKITI
jgi:hypothetical protein